MGGWDDWEVGISTHTSLCIKEVSVAQANQNPQYSARHSAQSSVGT